MPTKKELLLNLSLLILHKEKLEEELQQTNNLLKHAERQLEEVNAVNPAPVRTDPRLEAKESESESSTNGKRSARGEEASSPAKLQREQEEDPLELSAQEMSDGPPPNVDIGGVRRALVVGKINMNQEQKVVANNESSKLKGKENHSSCSSRSHSSLEQPPATALEKPSNKKVKTKRELVRCKPSECYHQVDPVEAQRDAGQMANNNNKRGVGMGMPIPNQPNFRFMPW